MMIKGACAASLCAFTLATPEWALAQQVEPRDPAGLEEIVVTAQRREESAQRAAISIDTISAAELERTGITRVDDLTLLTPALRAESVGGPYLAFTVRGISTLALNSFADGAVLLSVDGVPLAHPVAANGLFYDLERVEILKGPQGTLYGRNATGGAVNIISKRPDFKSGGSASIEYGSYDRKVANVAANAPLGQNAAARVAFQRVDRDGYFSDGTGDEDSIAARLSFRFEPVSGLRFLMVGDLSKDEGLGVGSSLLTTRVNPPLGPTADKATATFGPYVGLEDPRNASQFVLSNAPPRNFQPFQNNRYKGVMLQAEVDTGIGTATLVGAYRKADLLYLTTTATFYAGEDTASRQYSIEARLASSDDQPLRYVVGGYYLDDALDGQTLFEVNATVSNQVIGTTTVSRAAFGQLNYALADNLRLVGGLRYTNERKRTNSTRYRIAPFNFATTPLYPFPALNAGISNLVMDRNRKFSATTWKAGVEWDAAPDSLIYTNVSTGFKAGGFYFGPPDKSSYEPEHVTAYILGSKNRFFDQKLQVNGELFYLNYRDQQISYLGYTSAGTGFITENIGKASIYGAEMDLQWQMARSTRLGLNLQWQQGEYNRFSYLSAGPVADTQSCPFTATSTGFQLDCSGRRPLQLPQWTVGGSLQHHFELGSGATIVLDVNSRYETSRETALNYLPETRVGSYTRTDASLTFNAPGEHWFMMAFVKNIEDNAVIARVQPGRTYSVSNGGLLSATYQAPRTCGIRAGLRF